MYYQRASPPDIMFEEKTDNYQNRYTTGSTYEWNIDGASEQNILNILNQMIMFSNTNKSVPRTTDYVVALLLICGFTGQLKG